MKLQVENLQKVYGEKGVLKGLHLEVNSGEVVFLLGPNGAGKTTTIKILTGLLQKDDGDVRLDDTEISMPYEDDLKRKFFYLPDEPVCMEYLTGLENLAYMHEIYGISYTEEKLQGILTEFSLGEAARQLVKEYSRGMKQRLCLSYIKVYQPEILLLDEPTNGVDIMGIQMLVDLLKKIKEQNRIVLISSHDVDFCEQLADRIVVIDQGICVTAEEKNQLKDRYGSIHKMVRMLVKKWE